MPLTYQIAAKMPAKPYHLSLAAALMIGGLASTGSAQHVISTPSYFPAGEECTHILQGEINEDSVNLAISEISFELQFQSDINLCLNSPGGRISQARRLVEFMEVSNAQSIITIVDNDMVCRSACAFIFMSGFQCHNASCWASRYMGPFAVVGFHAPALEIDSQNIPETTLRQAYAASLNEISYFLSLNNDPRFHHSAVRFPTALLEKITANVGEDFYHVDRLLDVLTLDIRLFGAFKGPQTPEYTLGSEGMINACDNFFWRNRLHKGYPEEGYHFGIPGDSEYYSISIVENVANEYIYMNRLLGSQNYAWAVCYVPTGNDHSIDSPDINSMLDTSLGIYASLSSQNEIMTDGVDAYLSSTGALDSSKAIEIEDAWRIISPNSLAEEGWLYWSMGSYLHEIGQRY